MKNTAIAITSLLSLGLAACSVQQSNVVNNPPTFLDQGTIFKSSVTHEYGVLTPTGITLFYYPETDSEEEIRQAVRVIKGSSIGLDMLSVKFETFKKALAEKDKEFVAGKCLDLAESTTFNNDPNSEVDWVSEWKELEPVAEVPPAREGEPGHDEFTRYNEYREALETLNKCKSNQAEREAMIAWSYDGGMLKEKTELVDKLYAAIDPETYEAGPSTKKTQVNYKTVRTSGSSLVLVPLLGGDVRVEITLQDFIYPGHTRTNVPTPGMTELEKKKLIQNATYDKDKKLLIFAVPELDKNGNLTGNDLLFILERTPDFLGQARFSGDVKLRKDGKILRHGSGQLEGMMGPTP